MNYLEIIQEFHYTHTKIWSYITMRRKLEQLYTENIDKNIGKNIKLISTYKLMLIMKIHGLNWLP